MVCGSPLAAGFFFGWDGGLVHIEERGTVVEVRAQTALVRLRRSGSCADCASAGQCRAGHGESEQLLEAQNAVGAVAGDRVRVAVSVRSAIGSSAKAYLLPVAGLLTGAGVAEVLVANFMPSLAGGNAAGLGGIAGAILGLLLSRRPVRRPPAGTAALPRIIRIDGDVDAPSARG